MKILCVDDRYDTVAIVGSVFQGDQKSEIRHVSNSRDALSELKNASFDLMIVDIQIPEAIGEEINISGGQKLLEYIELNQEINKPTHIVGVTNHADSYNDCRSFFNSRGWALWLSSDGSDTLKNIIETKKYHCSINSPKYDIALITALTHTELEAVLKLPCDWTPVTERDDTSQYYAGIIQTENRKISLIATSCPRMGIAASAVVSTKLCLKFKPQFIIMVGIAAGIKTKVDLGDILIADPSWDWGSGKKTLKNKKPVFLSAPHQIPLLPKLRTLFTTLSMSKKYMEEIYRGWGGSRPNHAPKIHIGPVATGSVVLEDPDVVEEIKLQHRETIGVEMEGYGVAMAASNSTSEVSPVHIIIKSVCDFADPEKGDSWQAYAAYTSANLAYLLIKNDLVLA